MIVDGGDYGGWSVHHYQEALAKLKTSSGRPSDGSRAMDLIVGVEAVRYLDDSWLDGWG